MLNVAEKKPRANLLRRAGEEFVLQSPDKRAADWLEAEIERAQAGVTTQTVDLTPSLARALLRRNDGNRKLSEALVSSLARDIASGTWDFNGETIIVSKTGMMNDGQHRCEAVVSTDKPIKTVLVIGVERSSRTTVDQGRVRTAADFLAMTGHVSAPVLATAASHLWQYETFGLLATGSGRRPTKGEVLKTVQADEDAKDGPKLVASVGYCTIKGARLVGGVSLLAFVHHVLMKSAGKEASDRFIKQLVEGAGLGERSPILYARNRLINEGGRIRAPLKAELIFKAWNAAKRGESPRHIILTGSRLPDLEK